MEVRVRLRARNQLTLPASITTRLGLSPGNDLVIKVSDDQPLVAEIRPLRRTYAGVAAGIFGTPEDVHAYVQGERHAWD